MLFDVDELDAAQVVKMACKLLDQWERPAGIGFDPLDLVATVWRSAAVAIIARAEVLKMGPLPEVKTGQTLCDTDNSIAACLTALADQIPF